MQGKFALLARSRANRFWLFGVLLLCGLLLNAQTALGQALPDFTQLARENGPAVVNISTTQTQQASRRPQFNLPDVPDGPWSDLFRHFFGEGGEMPELESRSLGSGFVIDSDGHILTNHHVIVDADEIVVRLNDRREFIAEVVGSDERSDVALLKINATDLPVVKLGTGEGLEVGEWVMAIGSPFGFDHSVSVGVVSALGRSLPRDSYVPFIQTDVAINPGNSGGPLFNLKGEVIGINSQIYSRTGGFMGLSFAIPVDVAMHVVSQLRDQGYVSRGWLGVMIQDVTRPLAESFGMERPHGALVAQVLPESPAAAAGVQVGDVIVSFNGRQVNESSELPLFVGQAPVGEAARVTVIRDGKRRNLRVTIAELPGEAQLASPTRPEPRATNRLGVRVAELTADQRAQLGVEEGRGVLVRDVASGPAYAAGIRQGDVIVRLGRQDVGTVSDFERLVTELPAGQSVPVLIQRRGGPIFLALQVPGE